MGEVVYQLYLPTELSQIYNTFDVCQLHKCLVDDFVVVPLDDSHVDEHLNYDERPVAILDLKDENLAQQGGGLSEGEIETWRGSKWTWDP